MPIEIRSATLADHEAVNRIVRQGQDEHADALPHIFQKVDVVMPLDFYTSLVESENTNILLAVEDETVVGFSIVDIMSAPPFDSMVQRRFGYISDFGVDTAHQRKGIGKKLFAASVEWARSQGVTKLDLNVWEFNQKAIALYEGLGMHTISRKMSIDI